AAPKGPGLFVVPGFSPGSVGGRPSRVTRAVAAELFPAFFPVAEEPALADLVYGMFLGMLEAGLVSVDDAREQEPAFVALLRREVEGARAHQQVCEPGRINWKYQDPYADHRHLAGIALDIAGWWESP